MGHPDHASSSSGALAAGHFGFRRLVLASSSPRRQELLSQLGLVFEVIAPDVPEDLAGMDGPPEAIALSLARRKAMAVAPRVPDALVVAADTIVVVDREILGKPADRQEAASMLRRLAGRDHWVYTGVVVLDPASGREAQAVEATRVVMGAIAPDDLEGYLDTGEALDKAGAYAVQGRAAVFVRRIEGDYFNVVGLPLARLADLLSEFGVRVFG